MGVPKRTVRLCEGSSTPVRPYSSSELIAYLAEFEVRADREYAISALKDPAEYPNMRNAMDHLRDQIIAWARENWEVVRFYADCPLIEAGDKCYTCSDGMVAACYTVNKNKITKEDADEIDGCDEAD